MSGNQPDKMQVFLINLLWILAVVLTSVVDGESEKSGGGEAATVKPVDSGANVSDNSPSGTVKTPSFAVGSEKGKCAGLDGFGGLAFSSLFYSVEFMKTAADMALMMVASGGVAAMMVALKYYAVKMVSDFVESMTGYGYADDP